MSDEVDKEDGLMSILVNKRMLLIGAYTLISAAGLPALITLIIIN